MKRTCLQENTIKDQRKLIGNQCSEAKQNTDEQNSYEVNRNSPFGRICETKCSNFHPVEQLFEKLILYPKDNQIVKSFVRIERTFFILVTLILIFGFKQDEQKLIRILEGQLVIQKMPSTKIIFKLYHDSYENDVSATIDVPSRGVVDYPVEVTKYRTDSVVFKIRGNLSAKYIGKMLGDSIVGEWKPGGGSSFPLILKNGVEAKRPQIPIKPYPYFEDEVTYFNADSSIQFGATLTIPKTGNSFAAAILISGSGQEDRDESVYGHKPFLVIADYLTRNGIAVLRVDDREVGKTTGKCSNATSFDYSRDVLAGVEYLKSRSEINSKKIGLIGHSEGGVIASLAASNNEDIAFIVSLAGLGITGKELISSQIRQSFSELIIEKEALELRISFYLKMYEISANESDGSICVETLNNFLSSWIETHDSTTISNVGLKFTDSKWSIMDADFENIVKSVNKPWIKYFFCYDPKITYKNVKCPVLVLNGEKDKQVLCSINIKGFKSMKKEMKYKSMEIHQFPDLNHFFQHSITGDISEYEKIEETFSPEVLQLISSWIKKNCVQNN